MDNFLETQTQGRRISKTLSLSKKSLYNLTKLKVSVIFFKPLSYNSNSLWKGESYCNLKTQFLDYFCIMANE